MVDAYRRFIRSRILATLLEGRPSPKNLYVDASVLNEIKAYSITYIPGALPMTYFMGLQVRPIAEAKAHPNTILKVE